jgi:hypothetical protein
VDILAGDVKDTITEGKRNPAKRKGCGGGLKRRAIKKRPRDTSE